jgi:hypothetical protein
MGIQKQEFYEGAALHQIACNGVAASVQRDPPFFILDNRVLALLKYSTRNRSPWGFTFSPGEQVLLEQRSTMVRVVVGLICGADGIAALEYGSYRAIASPKDRSIHIACYRRRGEHYEVSGPDGIMAGKIPPSRWRQVLLRA